MNSRKVKEFLIWNQTICYNRIVEIFNSNSEEPDNNIQIIKNSLITIFTLTIFRTDRRIQKKQSHRNIHSDNIRDRRR